MTTEAPPIPPKKKPNIFWWIGGLFVLLLFVFTYQLFGPNPPIVLSPQTTYITSPLKPDGLPDYEKYTFDLYRKGVTADSNAAVPIWQAFWPGDLRPAQQAQMATELNLNQSPATVGPVVELRANVPKLDAWLKHPNSPAAESDDADSGSTQASSTTAEPTESTPGEELLYQTSTRPWTSQQIPPLAQWIAQNTKALDALVAVSHRPKFYSPTKTLLDNRDISLAEKMFTQSIIIGRLYEALLARAMWHVGEGRMEDAWRDLLEAHWLVRLIEQGHSLLEKEAAASIDFGTCESDLALLADPRLTAAQARQIYNDLTALTDFSGLDEALNTMDRIYYLDAVIRVAAGQTRLQKASGPFVPFDQNEIAYLTDVSIDWNRPLIKGNEAFDRAAAAVRLPTDAARRRACAKITADIWQTSFDRTHPSSVVAMALNASHRADAVSSLMLQQFFPNIERSLNIQDSANTMLELTRLAAALAVYRAEHNEYPQNLSDLTPTVIDQLPVDLYNAKNFIYMRTTDGYLLYSVGPNGRDENASAATYLFEGQALWELEDSAAAPLQAKIPAGADDIAIRLPRPPLAIPTRPTH